MILSGNLIQDYVLNPQIGSNYFILIYPYIGHQLNPNSYNLKLHNKLLVYDWCHGSPVDIKKKNKTKEIEIPKEGYTLNPNELYLGRTVEYTKTFGFVPMLEGRSSLARYGLSIHATAGFGDNGFCGYWTLEITCKIPITIYPFIEICQIYYHTIEGNLIEYNGKYQDNDSIQESLMWKEFE